MKLTQPPSTPIIVELIVRQKCRSSERLIQEVQALITNRSEIVLQITNIKMATLNRRALGGITPSVWVNDKLWFLGSFNRDRFISRINSMTA